MSKNKPRYNTSELKKALDLIEVGHSFSDTLANLPLNKSILAREIRKRKSIKALNQIQASINSFEEENYRIFSEYKK